MCWLVRRADELPTSFWVSFDIGFGILAPLVCLYFDPLFGGDSDGPRLIPTQLWVYAFSAFQCLTLLAWIVFRRPSGLLASTLGLGAVFATLVASIVVPISLVMGGVAVFSFIGSIGETTEHGSHPFDPICGAFFGGALLMSGLGLSTGCTALVYTRNCFRAMRQAIRQSAPTWPIVALTVGPVLALAVPSVAVQVARARASSAVQELLVASEAKEPAALHRLSSLRAFANEAIVRDQYWHETDPDRKAKLHRAYTVIARRRLDD